MRIEHAVVSDRRVLHVPQRQSLVIFIDEMPVTTSPAHHEWADDLRWTTAKYGALVEYACSDEEKATAGNFNVVFRDGFAPIVDVKVMLDDEALEGNWAVQLRRARNMMRKFTPKYTLVLSDKDAQSGMVEWVPTPIDPVCDAELLVYLPDGHVCRKAGTQQINKRGIDYWLCAEHTAAHDKQQHDLRISR